MHELLEETLIFLKIVNTSYMFNKIAQSLKYFIMAVNEEEFWKIKEPIIYICYEIHIISLKLNLKCEKKAHP